jgi:pseudouridine synthase
MDTSGLLLLTDDGGLIERLTHPRHGLIRTYLAAIPGVISDRDLMPLRNGVDYDGETYRPAVVRILRAGRGETSVRVEIGEGRKREVRMMFRAIGRKVSSLRRVSFGPVVLGGLPPGGFRPLTRTEVGLLKAKSPA